MVVENRRELRPVYRRGWSGDSGELWSGVEAERVSPNARAVTRVVTGGAILLAAALLVLFTDLWWLIFIFWWMLFPALGTFAKGVAGLMESRQRRGEKGNRPAAARPHALMRSSDEMSNPNLEKVPLPGGCSMIEIGHRFVETKGIRMHSAEAGSGLLVLLLHSFPEVWYSWRHQLVALAEAGLHAVAPDQRGFGQTGRPEKVADYTMLHLVGDAVGLLGSLGAEQAVVAGHDWGAPVALKTAQITTPSIKQGLKMVSAGKSGRIVRVLCPIDREVLVPEDPSRREAA
jgi:hypothetical protein